MTEKRTYYFLLAVDLVNNFVNTRYRVYEASYVLFSYYVYCICTYGFSLSATDV